MFSGSVEMKYWLKMGYSQFPLQIRFILTGETNVKQKWNFDQYLNITDLFWHHKMWWWSQNTDNIPLVDLSLLILTTLSPQDILNLELTHFWPMFSFFLWKHRKTFGSFGFLVFSRDKKGNISQKWVSEPFNYLKWKIEL